MRRSSVRMLAAAALVALAPACVQQEPMKVCGKFGASASLLGYGVDQKSKIGYTGGAFVTYNVSRRFALQPELLYVLKGQEGNHEAWNPVTGWEVCGFFDYHLTYLEMPLLARFTWDLSSLMPRGQKAPSIIFLLGPSLGLLVDARVTDISGAEQRTEDDVRSYADIGVVISTGLAADSSAGHFEWEILRMNFGTTEFFNSFGWGDIKNITFSSMMGFWF